MGTTYEFPRAIEAVLGFPSSLCLEVMRGDKGWVVAIRGQDVVRTGVGLSLDGALDDLASELQPPPPRLHNRGTKIATDRLRQLEKLFVSEATTLRISRPSLGEFKVSLSEAPAGVTRHAVNHSPALALTDLALSIV